MISAKNLMDMICTEAFEENEAQRESMPSSMRIDEDEFQLLTRALCCLAATEPELWPAAHALHSKLIFSKGTFVAGNSQVTPVATTRPLLP